MSAITENRYSGGAYLATGELAGDLRDVADDLATVKAATVASTSAAATTLPDASDDPTCQALANDLKAKYNAAVTLINELKTRLNAIAGGTLKTTKA